MTDISQRGPTRVLHIIDTLHSGGAERYLTTVVTELTRSGRAESFVLAGHPHRMHPPFAMTLREHASDLSFTTEPLYDPRLMRAQARAARRFGVDVIHSHLGVSNASSRIVAALLGKPHVSTVHLAPFPRVEDARRRMLADGLTARLSTRVIGVSPQTLEAYLRAFRVPADRGRVILTTPSERPLPAGYDRRAMRAELAGAADAQIVLAMCRLEERKGLVDLVDAAAELRTRLPNLRVLIAGQGPDEERLRRHIARAGAEDTVRLLGYRDDIGALLAAADVFCLPSYLEGLPVSILEAMQAGIPCVATDVGGTGHVVRDGETGLLVPPRQPRRLAEALGTVLAGGNGLVGSWTSAARRLVEQHCSGPVIAAQHADIYDELVLTGRRGRPAQAAG